MSHPDAHGGRPQRLSAREIMKWKRRGERIPVLTAYDFPTARILDRAGIPIILVGDSLGNVVLGYESTLPVTVEEMIHHARAVVRGRRRALVVVDMPFLSFQVSPEKTVEAAGRIIKETGADAVKIEGAGSRLQGIGRVVAAGIPVMGHLGLTPQSILDFGGYRVQAKGQAGRRRLVDDARRLEEAGCFSLVLEAVPRAAAREVTDTVAIPTIGIGAGAACDGQVLVLHDMCGLYDEFQPRFVRRFAELARGLETAVTEYMQAVRDGSFPADDESYMEE
ncbi:MAG: 3-methyl-2-oxobutanoate hydroxymethyltransferase [Candidatus Eisenbacteria bacterium]|nr:3-methyl-2-oxobutanoate hydroxymethyltransferase [Candidatus Eisenbacteria bacterium]